MTLAVLIEILTDAWIHVPSQSPEERTIEALLNALRKAAAEDAS